MGSSSCAESAARLRPNLLGSPLPLPVAWLRSASFRRAAVAGPAENPTRRQTLDGASRNMTLGKLIKGLALLLLLIATGQLRNLGPVELLIWLELVVAWIIWWVTRLARVRATP